MSLLSALVAAIAANPGLTTAAVGALVKVATDLWGKFAKDLDAKGVPQAAKVPLQMVVMVATAVATLANLYLHGQLSTYQVADAINFIVNALPTYLAAIGIHFSMKSLLTKTLKRETLLPNK